MRNQGLAKAPNVYVRILIVSLFTVGILATFASLGTGSISLPPAHDLHAATQNPVTRPAAVNDVDAQGKVPPCHCTGGHQLYPAEIKTIHNHSVIFAWTKAMEPRLTGYRLQIADSETFQEPQVDTDVLGLTYIAELDDGDWHWRVQSPGQIGLCGCPPAPNPGQWSRINTFSNISTPTPTNTPTPDMTTTPTFTPTPTPTSNRPPCYPTGGHQLYTPEIRPEAVIFGWTKAKEPYFSGYRIQIADNPAMSNPVVDAYATGLSYLTVLNNGTWHWRVKSPGQNGLCSSPPMENPGIWSETQSFHKGGATSTPEPCHRIYLPLILYPEAMQPDLSASYKIAFPEVVGYFDEITYTLVVRNDGSGPAHVTLRDMPPLPYMENSATGGLWWDEETQTLRWEGTINAADSRTFQYVVHGPSPIIPHDTRYWNELVIDDGVHPPFTRSAVVLANPWPTPTSTPALK